MWSLDAVLDTLAAVPGGATGLLLSLLLLTSLTYLLLARYTSASPGAAHLPPVVRAYPLLGIVPWLRDKPLEALFAELVPRYGDVFTVYFGSTPFVVLASCEAIKEALKQQPEMFSSRSGQRKGILMHKYGTSWKELRKFSLQVLRDFGVGKRSLEDTILQETDFLTSEINSKYGRGEGFTPNRLLQKAVSNIICGINFGNRFDYDDPDFQDLLDKVDCLFLTVRTGRSRLRMMFPFLLHVPFVRSYLMASGPATAFRKIQEYIRGKVHEHQESFDGNNIRDFIDLYLKSQNEGTLSKTIDDEELFQTIIDMFFAGTETTSTTLQWLLLFLCHHPDMQEKIHAELETVVGSGKRARMADKPHLPYTSAFLYEVQRHATIVPNAVIHATHVDGTFRGYHIPAGTSVFPVLWCAHRDPKHFPEPDRFNPNRWLNDKNEIIRHEAFMPFSVGPRFCLGEQLAKMELFLFFTGLVQTYKFTGCGPLPSYHEARSNVTRMPLVYQLRVEKRF